jgi:hypothetical protein
VIQVGLASRAALSVERSDSQGFVNPLPRVAVSTS